LKELMKMAAVEVFKSNESAGRFLGGVSENLHDILLYLNINKDDLPTKSEVSIDELFQLVSKAIKDADTIKAKLDSNERWLGALTRA
jgi:hypothetical protein